MLSVTTPIEPVSSAEPNRPLPRLRSSRRSSWRRQHIERIIVRVQVGVDEVLEVGQAVLRRHIEERVDILALPIESGVML